MTPGSRALRGYDGHRYQALAVSVWDDLTQQGLRVRDANVSASDGEGGVSLMLEDSGVSLSWKAHDDVERIIYDKSLR
ncbi:hypothetical protein ABZY93_08855, partial [Streptomyces smyrnaeus]|uniref:hypothetical protein n=1 Tax=Streptomyces smyrnaeus TaxID=1387713 RepID=UPI0033A8FC2D